MVKVKEVPRGGRKERRGRRHPCRENGRGYEEFPGLVRASQDRHTDFLRGFISVSPEPEKQERKSEKQRNEPDRHASPINLATPILTLTTGSLANLVRASTK